MKKTVLITGSSTGIGNAAVRYFQEQGWNVAATMRKPEEHQDLAQLENVNCYKLDVTDNSTIQEAVKKAIEDFGQIDVVVNNAGYGLIGVFEAATDEQIKRQFDTNLFGLMNVIKAVLPHFRSNKSGTIINITSIGGLITMPYVSLYHGTKWAVEGFSESLSYELDGLGIKVKIVEPGGVATDFVTRSADMAIDENISDYNQTFGKFNEAMNDLTNPENMSTPEKIAGVIFEAATDSSNRLRYLAGEDAKEYWRTRQEVGDDKFVENMKQQFL